MRWILSIAMAACTTPHPDVHVTSDVDDPGSEPREAIRLHYLTGATHRTRTTTDFTDLPTTTMTVDTSVLEVAADGTAKIRATIVDAEVPDMADRRFKNAAEALRGQETTQTVTAFGNVVATETNGKSADFISAFLRLGFPNEAIGVGARWSDSYKVAFQSSELAVTAHRTLTSRAGDALVIHSELTGTGGGNGHRQSFTITLTGTGDATFHLNAPLATSSSLSADLLFKAGETTHTFHMESKTE